METAVITETTTVTVTITDQTISGTAVATEIKEVGPVVLRGDLILVIIITGDTTGPRGLNTRVLSVS